MINDIDIMAPAGSFESLRAAIQAGADSVYFGVGKLNMRARSASFEIDDLEEIVRICRDAGIKSCLTLNTVVYDDDLETLRSLCERAKNAGVSAIIAMDMAVIEFAESIDLEVHISTQVNISNLEAVKYFSRYADVIVLARELSLEKIKHICSEIDKQNLCGPKGEPVRIEVFVHGALCIAISGKCYMSLAQFNTSANRGECYQSCRRSYTVKDSATDQELQIDNEFVMSPSDLCTLGQLDRIVDSGASVLKIEGRGRSPEYVYTVVKTYRNAVNDILAGNYTPEKKEKYIEEVKSVFNRGFWHGGYYLGISTDEWVSAAGSQATTQKVFVGVATNYYARNGVGEFHIQTKGIRVGDQLLITGPTTGVLQFIAESIHIENGSVDQAKKDEIIGIIVPEKIRPNDKLFRVVTVDI